MRILGVFAALAAVTIPASAHHSFAVYFDPEDTVVLEGTVTAFRFTNPHGTLVLDVDGQEWRAETNAPVVLRRRGWTRGSVRPGQHVTISGWRARDGRRYMRLREVRDEAGRMIGSAPFGKDDG
ncbi:DUF6152 family protein [Aurantiacibacter rhizosphaerae]|uniref:DUF5666 domain-containing protein n=1 Tax=Aurantiacibacter rhizosphaerae TaxID=2691582 RepID=A0A844XC18_9SPHN|nr:DUF6152 family protein [Aurantiacibacter rhizosphaerae]MWV27252.1 hypothetical protein [Aurantiacibacter rhizosphaerae]